MLLRILQHVFQLLSDGEKKSIRALINFFFEIILRRKSNTMNVCMLPRVSITTPSSVSSSSVPSSMRTREGGAQQSDSS